MATAPTFGSNPTDYSKKWENATDAIQYTVAKVGANDEGCDLAVATSSFPIGIIQNDPKQNQMATLRPAGRSLAVAGAAITRGARVIVDSSGRLVTYTRGNVAAGTAVYVVGTALTSASAADKLFELLISQTEGQL